ncbi:GNAT family N-acetyltransferase [Marinimicrococcus flavescens]|uniref:L-ornithine N(alpha)-acyltransferase n=1 Tax=Marinimicrococcus flavescens TaxID=3031815 RepID=A0AAP3V1N4_9PROT|nr:GNAT family N-acetyltransferase [Marinimicrococcus flavescens]
MTLIAQVNELELRWAQEARELAAAQALRYQVFYEEMGAVPDAGARLERRDRDAFDAIARHLIVVDRSRSTGGTPAVVGCYRLLRESVARRHGGFYTATEFDLGGLSSEAGEVLELGRSCVHADYRGGAVMQLLWRGIAEYQARHRFGLMIGCASLPGRDVARVARQVRYLHERHLAPLGLRPCARSSRRVAHEPFAAAAYDPSVAFRRLPPLMKGYLRLGAMIGEGAVLDEQFNTIDLCIVLPTDRIEARYRRHYAVQPAREPAFA